MATPVWINNLIAYSLQIAILAAAGTLLAYLFRLRLPRVTCIYWQMLLFACICVPLLQRWEHPVLQRAILRAVDAKPAIANMAVPSSAESQALASWEMLALLLAAGIFLRFVWLAVGFYRLRLFRRDSCMFLEEHAAVRDLQWRTGVRASLLLSNEIDSPVTFGLRPPTIILPLSFRNLSEPCQKAVLCHELLHVRRYDWILIIVEEIICSLFWFHPAVWWLRGRIRLSREQAVDHEVVQLTGSRQPYLELLLEFARARGRPKAVPAPLFLRERHLVKRISLLLKEVSMSRSRLAVSMIGISILLICTVRLAAAWFPLTGTPVTIHEQSLSSAANTRLIQAPVHAAKQAAGVAAKSRMKQVSTSAHAPLSMVQTVAITAEAPAHAQEQITEPQVRPPQGVPIRVGGNVQESRLIRKVNPQYPEQAKREGIQGTVRFEVIVNEEGLVYEIRTDPDNNPILEEAAIEAIKEWRYSPTLLNGMPVPVIATVTVIFQLKATPAPGEEQNFSSEIKAPGPGPIRVGSSVQESKLIRRVEPVYPELAKRARVQGRVVLAINVDEEGFVTDAKVVSGHPLLNEAAINAVKQWQYSPTLMDGVAVPVMATVTVIFALE